MSQTADDEDQADGDAKHRVGKPPRAFGRGQKSVDSLKAHAHLSSRSGFWLKSARGQYRQAEADAVYPATIRGTRGFVIDLRARSEEHTFELHSLIRILYSYLFLKKKNA